MERPLAGKVALVAGATRGAGRGIAVELGAAGATVYATGRTTRSERSEMNRPETIDETAALVDEAGGRGIAVQVVGVQDCPYVTQGVSRDAGDLGFGGTDKGQARHCRASQVVEGDADDTGLSASFSPG